MVRLAAVAVLAGCGPCGHCPPNMFTDITDLPVHADMVTQSGTKVDSGGFAVDLEALDRRILAILECVRNVAEPAKPEWQCMRDMPYTEPDCLVVKVVPPVVSECSDWQFIGVAAPDSLCEAKGMVPTPKCPCMWRQVIQGDWTVVTPVAMYLWDVGRAATSCLGVWNTPYAKCLMF